ncbi:MAG: DUF5519 family protein [Spirochaetaceae bacterium]
MEKFKLIIIFIVINIIGLNSLEVDNQILTPFDFNIISGEFSRISERKGEAPEFATGIPHQQYSQNAPVVLQEQLRVAISKLPGVVLEPTPYSLAGSIGWRLKKTFAGDLSGAFIRDSLEFAHQHIPSDGSLHMILPNNIAKSVIEKGWGIMHPWTDSISGENSEYLMIFGPRDEEELKVIWIISQISYLYARGMEVRL